MTTKDSPAAKALLNAKIVSRRRVYTDFAAGEAPEFKTLPENIIYQQLRTALAGCPEIYVSTAEQKPAIGRRKTRPLALLRAGNVGRA